MLSFFAASLMNLLSDLLWPAATVWVLWRLELLARQWWAERQVQLTNKTIARIDSDIARLTDQVASLNLARGMRDDRA